MALAREGGSAALFSGNAAGTLRLIGYLALACVLMVSDRHLGLLAQARHAAAVLIDPVYAAASLPTRLWRSAAVALSDRNRLVDENARLREALLLANARLNRMHTLVDQNQRLQQLLDVQHMLGVNVQLAHVLGVDLGAFRNRLVIDAGDEEGVHVGMVVIDAHGVMGQVTAVSRHTATVMLVTDPNHAVPVVDERSGLRTIAYGTGSQGLLRLDAVPLTADVQIGDRLLTSGIGGRFPAGFPLGSVTSVAPDRDGGFAFAEVTPAAALDRSAEVLLLRDLPPPVGPPAPASVVGPPSVLRPDAATDGAARP
ncbi:MAG TPA: rod shape-determining protein MreC [Rhodanobacteraceae bacterium]|nr:rod shape-determining protein MreC [Rhodanobacteraceae bacterium]